MSVWKGCRAVAADLLLGEQCAGCRRPGLLLCPRCRSALKSKPHLVSPDPRPLGLPDVYAVAAYAGPVKGAILAHKEKARLALAAPLGQALSSAASAVVARAGHPITEVTLIPVPSSRRSVRGRGHDPLLRSARYAARYLRRDGVDVRLGALLTVERRLADQAGLGARERASNLAGAFSARPSRSPLPTEALILDDVITTGATAAEAARALSVAGIHVLGVAVVAATIRRSQAGRSVSVCDTSD